MERTRSLHLRIPQTYGKIRSELLTPAGPNPASAEMGNPFVYNGAAINGIASAINGEVSSSVQARLPATPLDNDALGSLQQYVENYFLAPNDNDAQANLRNRETEIALENLRLLGEGEVTQASQPAVLQSLVMPHYNQAQPQVHPNVQPQAPQQPLAQAVDDDAQQQAVVALPPVHNEADEEMDTASKKKKKRTPRSGKLSLARKIRLAANMLGDLAELLMVLSSNLDHD